SSRTVTVRWVPKPCAPVPRAPNVEAQPAKRPTSSTISFRPLSCPRISLPTMVISLCCKVSLPPPPRHLYAPGDAGVNSACRGEPQLPVEYLLEIGDFRLDHAQLALILYF